MSLNEQAENIRRSIEFIRNGSLGIVTDGDKYLRPHSSMRELSNVDYDNEVNLLKTRNSFHSFTENLLSGLEFPDDYEIMEGGIQSFSFNDPIDREVVVLFLKHTVNGDVKIYLNQYYNPPSDQIIVGALGSVRRYENADTSRATGWYKEWTELTEYHLLNTFNKLSDLTLSVSGADLSTDTNKYRGWFLWNSTKWNTGKTDAIRASSFICIEDFVNDGTTATITIQKRDAGLRLNGLGWNDNDIVYLIRYPLVVYKAENTSTGSIDLSMKFTPYGDKWILKTNTSLNCLIGQEGNLQISFLNKDITKISDDDISYLAVQINTFKYFGWWMDYQQVPKTVAITAGLGAFTIDYRYGLKIFTSGYASTGSQIKAIASVAVLDFTQRICVFKAQDEAGAADTGLTITQLAYHGYSRRITGMRHYTSGSSNPLEDPIGYNFSHDVKYFNPIANEYRYQPVYASLVGYSSLGYTNPTTLNTANATLSADIGYQPTEDIWTKDKFGTISKDMLLTAGDSEKPDRISYSLVQDGVISEDVFATQNRLSVGGADKDKLTAIIAQDKIVYAVKTNSIHKYVMRNDAAGFNYLGQITKIGTSYHRTILTTSLGLMFINDAGIWLVDGNKEINILAESRLQEYYSLNKDLIFAIWYERKKEAWFFIGDRKVWILKYTQRTRQIGWKDYDLLCDITGFMIDEGSNLWIHTTNLAYRLLSDDQDTDGHDFGLPFSWKIRENLMLLREQEKTRHRRWKPVEHKIYYEIEPQDGLPDNPVEIIHWKIYKNETDVYAEGDFEIRVDEIPQAEFIPLRNVRAKAEKAFAMELSGTLTYCKRITFSEFFTRATLLGQPIKGGTIKPALI